MTGEARPIEVAVHCYAGYRGQERPRSFRLADKEYQVAEVVETWRTPQARFFRVRTTDQQLYLLSHQEDDDCWQLL